MSILEVNETSVPKKTSHAIAFQKQLNKEFENTLQKSYSDVVAFWYRNRDKDGNESFKPSEDGQVKDEPTGVEMLEEMGTNALKFMLAAGERAKMLVAIAAALGKLESVDQTKLSIPFKLEWNPDGSLKNATEV